MFKRKNDDTEKPKSKRKRDERNWLHIGLVAGLVIGIVGGVLMYWMIPLLRPEFPPLPTMSRLNLDLPTPSPIALPNSGPIIIDEPRNVLPCDDIELLTERLEVGGTWEFPCKHGAALLRPIVIKHDTMLIGSDTMSVTLSGRNALESIFRVENGATLTLKDISLASSRRYGVYVASASKLIGHNCSFAYIGSEFGPSAAILNDGTVNLYNCWLGENSNDANFMNAALVSSLYSSTIIQQTNFIGNETAIQAYGALTLDNIIFGDNETDCIATSTLVDPDHVCQPGQP